MRAATLTLLAVAGALLSTLLSWAATTAFAALTLLGVPVLLMFGVVAIAFAVQLVSVILGGSG